MKNNLNSPFAIFSILGIAILLLGILIGFIVKSPVSDTLTMNPNIIVKDSIDFKKLNNSSYKEAALVFEKSVESTIDKEFDRTINYLNFTIALFASFLTITLVAFGFFTIRKMAEAKEMLDKIIAAPDLVMQKYHDNQLNELLPKLLSSDNREKSDAIQSIYSNTQLDEEKHFDILSNAIDREYQYSNSYTYLNVFNLFDSMSRLNYSKTILKGFELFENNHKDSTMQFVVPRIMESKERGHKERFLNLLCSEDNSLVNDLIKNIDHFENFDKEMIIYLSKNASTQITFRIINSINQKNNQLINYRDLISELYKKVFTYNYFHQFINLLRQQNQLDKEIIIELVDKIIESDETNIDYFSNIIRTIINSSLLENEKVFIIKTLHEKYSSTYNISDILSKIKDENNPNFLNMELQFKNGGLL